MGYARLFVESYENIMGGKMYTINIPYYKWCKKLCHISNTSGLNWDKELY